MLEFESVVRFLHFVLVELASLRSGATPVRNGLLTQAVPVATRCECWSSADTVVGGA